MPSVALKPTDKPVQNYCAALWVGERRREPVKAVLSGALPSRMALLLFALLLAFGIAAAESKRKEPAKWVTLNECRFMSEENSDGDSFHIKYGQREFILRLYFVDAPETDEKLKDRIREQCGYFGVSPEEILKSGEAAKKFTAEWLRRPFTAKTRWQNAMGRSRLPRYYALIEANGQDLAELLVSRGLARAKGAVAILPDGSPAKDHIEKLRKVEAGARSKQLGIWAQSKLAGQLHHVFHLLASDGALQVSRFALEASTCRAQSCGRPTQTGCWAP